MADRPKASTLELLVSYAAAFLLFPLGLLLGVNLLRRDFSLDGIRVVAISVAAGVISVLNVAIGLDDAVIGFALAAIAMLLVISFLVQGRLRAGIALGVITVGAVALMVFADDPGDVNDRVRELSKERDTNELARCVNAGQVPVETCVKRWNGE